MNRGQILDLAMKKAEVSSSDAKDTGRDLLNIAVTRLAREYRFPTYLRTSSLSFTTGKYIYDLPANYMKHFGLKIETSRNNEAINYEPMFPITREEHSFMITKNASGRPQFFYVDRQLQPDLVDGSTDVMKLNLVENPNKLYPGILEYYMIPAEVPKNDTTYYDSTTIEIPDYIMIEALVHEFFEYWDDDNKDRQWKKVEEYMKRFLRTENDVAGKQDQIPFDRAVFNTGYNNRWSSRWIPNE